MQFQIPIHIKTPKTKIHYNDKVMLLGSCFTEHIGQRFANFGWDVVENPTGIIFNPDSIYKALDRVANRKLIVEDTLIQHNELFHHWDFHSRFSALDPTIAVQQMNDQIDLAHRFIQDVDWVILTLGSSFQYFFVNENNYGVANCHRVPANQFEKRMLELYEIIDRLGKSINLIQRYKPTAKVLITISPVRHIKDGVVENNISKARLLEATHQLVNDKDIFYFPAYELLIDVLRDYRYYDVDLVHPNYAATQFVWEQLVSQFFEDDTKVYVQDMIKLNDLYKHRTMHPGTQAHKNFLLNATKLVDNLKVKYPTRHFDKYEQHFLKALLALS